MEAISAGTYEKEEWRLGYERKGGEFFACSYLLTPSKSVPKHGSVTYVGFTLHPKRRLRQHNGELKQGAYFTRRHRCVTACSVHARPVRDVFLFQALGHVCLCAWISVLLLCAAIRIRFVFANMTKDSAHLTQHASLAEPLHLPLHSGFTSVH